jgi:hypothetical protein
MSKQTLCYLVLGAGLGAMLLKLSQQPEADSAETIGQDSGNVISLAAWKEAHGRSDMIANAR